MPIFTYVVVAGSALIALLFVMAATLEEAAPPIVTSERQGLPKPWHPDPIQVLTAEPAPSPNMTSEAVLAAQPKAAPAAPVAKSDGAPKKRHVTRRLPLDEYRQSYGWSREPFGGFFGRY